MTGALKESIANRALCQRHGEVRLTGEPQRPVHPDFGRAMVDGRGFEDVTAEQLDDFLFGTGNLG